MEIDWAEYHQSERIWTAVEGYVDVDAGLMMVGDPCYTLPDLDYDSARDELGRDWGKFCDRLWEEEDEVLKEKGIDPHVSLFKKNEDGTVVVDDIGRPILLSPEEEMEQRKRIEMQKPRVYHPWKKQPGAAVVTQTGFGDGTYPVIVEYVEYDHGKYGKEIRVKSVKVEFIGSDDEEVDSED